MSTRSLIGIENLDKSISYAYCHWDGYPEGVGKDIVGMDRNAARDLINNGDMSAVGEPYGGDDVVHRACGGIDEFRDARSDHGCDFAYYIDLTGVWRFFTHGLSRGASLREELGI
jgi:hypothetical protein